MPSIPLSDYPRVTLLENLLREIYERPWPFVRISGFWTSPDVPYGHYHPQWDTNGHLWIWISKAAFNDVPFVEDPANEPTVLTQGILPPSLTGIPVIHR